MKSWWAGLASRERVVLGGGATLLALMLIYLMVWEPIAIQREQLRSDISGLSADLAWMQQVAVQVKSHASQQSNQPSAGAVGGSVLTLVEVSARAAGLHGALERVQPEEQGARLWFTDTGFDGLLRWLGELELRHGLRVSQLAVDAGNAPGMVTARIKLEPR